MFLLIFVGLLQSCSEKSNIQELAQTNLDKEHLNTDQSVNLKEAVIQSVVDPITINVLLDNELKTIKLLGLELPDLNTQNTPYLNAINFTKFHLKIGGKVKLENDLLLSNEQPPIYYLYVDGEMYNKLILQNGYAKVSTLFTDFKYKDDFFYLEQSARHSNIGFWANYSASNHTLNDRVKNSKINSPAGTLPTLKQKSLPNLRCDFSFNNTPTIKGNIDSVTKIKTYYSPDSIFYNTIEVNQNNGDIWFCTEREAQVQGWNKSKH